MTDTFYPIGQVGTPWGPTEKALWLQQQKIQRSYFEDVASPLATIAEGFDKVTYGELPYPDRVQGTYPLYAVKSQDWDTTKPSVLVTGGVHGYETSGVLGALAFIQAQAPATTRLSTSWFCPV